MFELLGLRSSINMNFMVNETSLLVFILKGRQKIIYNFQLQFLLTLDALCVLIKSLQKRQDVETVHS